jgi:hypothetical protein
MITGVNYFEIGISILVLHHTYIQHLDFHTVCSLFKTIQHLDFYAVYSLFKYMIQHTLGELVFLFHNIHIQHL